MSESTAMVVAPEAPLPVFSGVQMGKALKAYRELQAALDAGMPDQIMDLDGKKFRKKAYWKAVAVAFDLKVELLKEERVRIGDGFAWLVTYRAQAPNGRIADGDGACGSEEKSRGRMRATEHNVRSHAHTRAANRATSNLCGFGEVSAEEAEAPPEDLPVITVSAPAEEVVTPMKAPARHYYIRATQDGQSSNGNSYMEITFDRAVTPEGYKKLKTWDAEVAKLAHEACEMGWPVDPVIIQKGKYFNVVGLEVVKG